jgi:hypothetical protein
MAPNPPSAPGGDEVTARAHAAAVADRAIRVAADEASERRRRSLAGRGERVVRWLRNPRTGPGPRARRVARALVDVIASPRTVPGLPGALWAALRLRSGGPRPVRPPMATRAIEAEAARARLEALRVALATGPRPVPVAVIADRTPAATLPLDWDLVPLRPEDWRAALEGKRPTLLLVQSAWAGNGGAWQYRLASYTHPDALLGRDLRALLRWCADHAVATVFWDTTGPKATARFRDRAPLFDLVATGEGLAGLAAGLGVDLVGRA